MSSLWNTDNTENGKLKVLSPFHILDRGYCSNSIPQLSFIEDSTINAMLKHSLSNSRKHYISRLDFWRDKSSW